MTNQAEIKNNFESKWYIDIETNSRGHKTAVPVQQGVTLWEIDDTVKKVKLKDKILNKRKIPVSLGYVALIIFAIWFVTGLVMDSYSHIGADIPISP